MPIYDYLCGGGHRIEARRGYETTQIPCTLCGEAAQREAIYFSQSLATETGVRSGRRNPIPRDERRYDLSLFREASAEREDAYARAELETGKSLSGPSLWRNAVQRSREIRSGVSAPIDGKA